MLKIVINCSSKKKKKGGGKEADRSVNAGELDVKSLTWSRTWLLVVLYFSAIASATALVPRNKVFQLCELERNREFKCKLKKHISMKNRETDGHFDPDYLELKALVLASFCRL